MSDERIDAAIRGARALPVAVDALAMIATMGGVQADWAVTALREVGHIIGAQPTLRVVPEPNFDAAVGEGRR